MAYILGVKINELTFKQVIEKINIFLETKKLHQIVTVNPEFVVEAQKNVEFKKILNSADLSVADGFGLKIGAIISGQKIGERITGVDLTWEICKIAAEKKYSVFFLGGRSGVGESAVKRIKIIYPDLMVAGIFEGKPNDPSTIKIIQRANPNILFVAFGAPKQDKFIYKIKNSCLAGGQVKFKIKNLKLAIGVGGTFDYISGKVPRAPKWIRVIGLEWFFRLINQPSRIKRIFKAVAVFPALVIINKLFSR